MGAIAAVYLAALSSGDTIVISKESYGTTQDLALNLSKLGIKTVLAGPDTEDFLRRIDRRVSLVLIETMTNPLVRVVDIPAITKRCQEVGAKLVVDNTFATPLLYRPLDQGAWLSIHSVTKYIGGHNDVTGGAIALNDPIDLVELWEFRRRLGSIMGPFEAFLALRGVASLKARFDVQCKSALALASFLEDHPRVEEVYYPGLKDNPSHKMANRLFLAKGLYGGVLSFKVKGGKSKALEVHQEDRRDHPFPEPRWDGDAPHLPAHERVEDDFARRQEGAGHNREPPEAGRWPRGHRWTSRPTWSRPSPRARLQHAANMDYCSRKVI